MEDDIDDLLDEVESKFCLENSPKKSANKTSRQRVEATSKTTKSSRPSKAKAGDDLNDIIRDICDDDFDIPNLPAARPTSKTKNPAPTSGHKPKCLKLLLGGSKYSIGLYTVSEQKTCDQLRCTSCDFKVVMFDNFQWKDDCDYLFFRNNVPDFHKLKAKLTTSRGYRAYACQCTWRSVLDITDVHSDSKLKWVCGKHR